MPTPIEEEIIGNLDEIDDATDNEPIEEVDDVQIGEVVVDRVGFKDAKSTFLTLKQCLEHKDILMIHLPSRAFERFKHKHDLGVHKNPIKLL